jgi:fermentation-respiration switch protein FrsA (DUF1100 family)
MIGLMEGCGIERSLIFFPEKAIEATPADVGISFEDLYLSTSDGVRINAWYVPYSGAKVSLLWFHGNAGNLSHRVGHLRDLYHEVGVNVLMVDYREYGRSEGRVSEIGTYQDALAAYDYLAKRPELDASKIVVYGQSLGSAIAVELAVQRHIDGLILEAPFTSIRAMASFHFPWLPLGGLLSTRYDSMEKIGKVHTPLLILHGDQDDIIPYRQGEELYRAANPPKRFYTIRKAGHNDTYLVGGKDYFRAIRDFIESLRINPG